MGQEGRQPASCPLPPLSLEVLPYLLILNIISFLLVPPPPGATWGGPKVWFVPWFTPEPVLAMHILCWHHWDHMLHGTQVDPSACIQSHL
jgi:hypothetical protein